VSRELDVAADQNKGVADADLPLPKVLATLASILRDSTGRFEETSDRIAQLVVARESGSGVDIIVALQEFDRLRQDFEAIEGILAGCAQAIERAAANESGRPLREVIAEIPVVDFKNRFARRLAWVSQDLNTADTAFVEEAIF
jgi:phosphoglycerate-specific signal transduction histidine kinase